MASQTKNPSDYCTIGTCPMSEANFTYIPSLAGNATYLALFALIVVPQVILGIRYRTWSYTIPIVCALLLEIIGYAGRLQLHYNPFLFDPFLEYLICLTIAPAFISAAIYLCLGRITQVYGGSISRIPPRWYTIIFVTCDVVALVLQAVGGALTATADHDQKALHDAGLHTMVAGLAFQVASLFFFMTLCVDFAVRVRKQAANRNLTIKDMWSTRKWQGFIAALGLATLLTFIRCVFRCAELSGGFNGALFNDEIAFMVLEGPMIIIASLLLTVFHPGLSFGRAWSIQKLTACCEGTVASKQVMELGETLL